MSNIEESIVSNVIKLMRDFYEKTNDEEETISLASAFLYIHKAVNDKWIPSKDVDKILDDVVKEVIGSI